jgi:hypothetical protein
MQKKVVTVLAPQAHLKRSLRAHFRKLGLHHEVDGRMAPKDANKDTFREMHAHQRAAKLDVHRNFISDKTDLLRDVLATGSEIDPARISLVLQRVEKGTKESDLFRLASLTWSVPVSNGFGRRLRYLVWDSYHQKLAGLIALGDPVFNLSVRDDLIGWSSSDRSERLVNVLDAYVLGSIPPYNSLLMGKVIACLVRTKNVYADFLETYGSRNGIISGENKQARLLLVTTSSSLGRSSVYNRLKLGKIAYYKSIGYTQGWGHFHISDEIFARLREFLATIDHPYVKQNRFGQGPNWRLRTIRAALKELGLSEASLHHGLRREVFMCELAENALSILKNGRGKPNVTSLSSVSEVCAEGIERWVIPRAASRPEYKLWKPEALIERLQVRPAVASNQLRLTNAN